MPLSPSTIHEPVHDVSWDFEGQVVLVTGAAHGQGAQHALAFAEAGAHLVIADAPAEMEYVEYPLGTALELEGVAQGVRDAGGQCLASPCDVRQPEQVRDLVDRAMAKFGRIDVALSNAGIGTVSTVVGMPLIQWAETIDTNLSGTFYLCKYVAPHMMAAKAGRIVVTGSTQSFGGMHSISHYTASKHGLLGLVKGFATELEPHGVTINLVCPTAIDTIINGPFTDPKYGDWAAKAGAIVGAWNLFQQGMMHEREVTEAIMWLASKEAGRVSGTSLMVDAGCMCK